MTPALVLGTAQFGMAYPPLRASDALPTQPLESTVREMLTEAHALGIRTLDTAAAYGDAETRLGAWMPTRPPAVISKLRPNLFDMTQGRGPVLSVVLDEIHGSLERLRVPRLAGYLVHTPRYIYRSDIVEALRMVQRLGLTARVGVSVYEPADAEQAVSEGLDVCVPLNALDRRFGHVCRRAKGAGLQVWARSPFLQGLLCMVPEEVPARLAHAREAVAQYRAACEAVGLAPARAALAFALAQPDVDGVVMGVDDLGQLRANVAVWRDPPEVDWQQFARQLPAVERAVCNPSLWAKKETA